MTTQTQLLNALARHQGREHGIRARDLARDLAIPPRQLRRLVSQAREEGFAICGRPESGYFMPVTAEELQESCDFLINRAMHSLRKASRMTKVSLPALLGQLAITQA